MSPLTSRSSPEAKIALFQSRFRGREDVYPRRFESLRSGKSGYAPACANEWVRGLCEKPRIKCAQCPNRRFLAVTEEVIRWHLSGRDDRGLPFVMGVYPMLLDETCHFLAVDFDGNGWWAEASAYAGTCSRLGVPAAVERSRSGNGGHVWIFFAEAVPATLARKLGAHVLTEAMAAHPELGFGAYDRFFPNQDTLPKGGFGNLIALPLQYQPRMQGNSVFLDEEGLPCEDQWEHLASVERITRARAETLVEEAARRGEITGVRRVMPEEEWSLTPWFAPPSREPGDEVAGPLPERLELILGDQIYLEKAALSPPLRNRLLRLAAFQNPEFHRAQAMRLPTWGKPRIIACAEELPEHIGLPRGCLEELRALLRKLGIKSRVVDRRHRGTPVELTFQGVLRSDQQQAAEALLAHDTGVLAATTAFGKTVLAAWIIAQRGVNTLVLVHRRQLMEQWVERLAEFLDLEEKEIGRLGGGRRKLRGKVDLALLQSVVRKGVVDDRIADYGQVIVDECHHVSARNFELAVRRAKAQYLLGLSATVTRKDGHHPIIFMQCGPVRHRVDAAEQAAASSFSRQVVVRPTDFRPLGEEAEDARAEFQQLYDELTEDSARNRMICEDVRVAVEEGRAPLVLTERTRHLELLAEGLRERGVTVATLRGGLSKAVLGEELEKAGRIAGGDGTDGAGGGGTSGDNGAGRERLAIVATGKFVGEGFDLARLDTLFLTLPVSWKGTIAQYAGRLHRRHEGKREVRILDYADLEVPMLSRMLDRRCRGYESLGYTILLPASAMPGWPREVPLPIDPAWKRDYAASVKRLLRDGVDATLAQLFVGVAGGPGGPEREAHLENRARSASERFLHRRLETLKATRGRFRLNEVLAIPFGGRGGMEVDFLDREHRIAIELDGDQHLGDPEAYRSDRLKDHLLQEHGYLVLRFLARDLGTDLDEVLDRILRALSCREREMRAGGTAIP